MWEVRTLLDRPLRLRTACDLELQSLDVKRPGGWELPDAPALAKEITNTSVRFDSDGPHVAVFE